MRLNQIADYIKEDPRIVELTITVHTDKLGELADNQKLTEDQASIIKKFFTDKGVLENKITVRALGQGDSVVLNDTKVNKRINRRVLIEVGRTEVRD
jgi:outer membrane protein OmpA-like peptidoglycan-associated protein